MIHDVVQSYIEEKHNENEWDWHDKHNEKLAVSEIGGCLRMPILRISGVEKTNPPDAYLKRLFYSGRMAEEKLAIPLRAEFPDLQEQVHLETEYFVGTVDFLVPEYMVIEHKETGHNSWKYNDLPKSGHLLQLAGYAELLDVEFAVLYYQNQAKWAEFQLYGKHNRHYEGQTSDKGKSLAGTVKQSARTHMGAMRGVYDTYQDTGEVPHRHPDPFVDGHCTSIYGKKAYQRCPWFDYCWEGTEWEGKNKLRVQ